MGILWQLSVETTSDRLAPGILNGIYKSQCPDTSHVLWGVLTTWAAFRRVIVNAV